LVVLSLSYTCVSYADTSQSWNFCTVTKIPFEENSLYNLQTHLQQPLISQRKLRRTLDLIAQFRCRNMARMSQSFSKNCCKMASIETN